MGLQAFHRYIQTLYRFLDLAIPQDSIGSEGLGMLNNVPHKHTAYMDLNKEVCAAAMSSCAGGLVLRLCTLCLSDLWQIAYN